MTTVLLILIITLSCSRTPSTVDKIELPLSQRPEVQFEIDRLLTTPTLIKGNLSTLDDLSPENPSESALLFIEQNKNEFRLNNPRSELIVSKQSRDNVGFSHITFERIEKEIPIFGDELKVHFNKEDILYFVNGRYHPSISPEFDTTPKLSLSQAEQIVLEEHKEDNSDIESENPELVILPHNNKYFLAYKITLVGTLFNPTNMIIFIDANNGDTIQSINNLQQ